MIVTGCNAGIGLELVGELARRGAHVVMACRSRDRCHAAREQLLRRFGVDSASSAGDRPSDIILTPITGDQVGRDGLTVIFVCGLSDDLVS